MADDNNKNQELWDRQDAEAYRRLPEALRRLSNTPGGDLRLLAEWGEGSENASSGRGRRGSTYLEGRRALAKELADRGLLNEQRLALEILFLLPEGFVRFYEELFHNALGGGEQASVMHGRSGGLEKAKGTTGIRLGSEVGTQASGTGKRWKNLGMAVRNEKALKVKAMVDQGLQALMDSGMEELRQFQSGAVSGSGDSTRHATRCQGEKCGRFLKSGWRYCPGCGYQVGS